MSIGQMILTPVDPNRVPDNKEVLNLLQGMQLIGDNILGQPEHYLAGDQFMQLITFAGCAPFLRFEPDSPEDNEYCHLRFQNWQQSTPLFLYGDNTKPPACPMCRKGITQWSNLFQDQPWAASHAHCPHCGEILAMPALNWRKHAGFGRLLLRIHGVFPGEAVPTPLLLNSLRHCTNTDWHYFYISRRNPE